MLIRKLKNDLFKVPTQIYIKLDNQFLILYVFNYEFWPPYASWKMFTDVINSSDKE